MSRFGDLYWVAVAKSTPPVRRIYFDTEPLRRGNWPFDSTTLGYYLLMASNMGIVLCVPDPSLHERAEQWIRETLAAIVATSEKATTAQKALKSAGLELTLQSPTEHQLRVSYAEAEREALQIYRLQRIPYASRPLDEIFRMAVARDLTFQERKDGVVGLQDCVILLSVLDHLKTNPVPSAFVSNDRIFTEISNTALGSSELRLIRGLTELEQILDAAVEASFNADFRRMWEYLTTRIRALLNEHRDEIQRFIEQNIDTAELEKLFSGRIVSKEPPTIKQFGAIHPEMQGEADDPLLFSCDATVSYTANLEERLTTLASLLGAQSDAELSQFSSQIVSRERSAVVDLTAQINPDYTNLRLNAARIRA